jgi:hypothetical protein
MAVMNILTEKIITRFLVIMFGLNLIAAPAGAVNLRAKNMCCCSAMSITLYKPLPAIYSSGDECCSCSTKSTCNFRKNLKYEEQTFMVSSTRENKQKFGSLISFVICEHFFFQTVKGYGTQTQFSSTNHFIPIYLQNSVLIC